ncbi:MAG: biotin transporter BioY [Brevundimonas sp.]|nr:biotin transporter BioY [Brevundimonas sp.]MBP8073021.1 biotin transporter BioY [Brevundimonas sp.]
MTAPSSLPLRLAASLGFVLLIAVCARLTVPMVPVPMTMQTWAVLLAGMVFGARWGGGAVLLYLALGLAGLPVFSDGASGVGPLTGPTAGYLFAFPLAAAVAGALVRNARLRGILPATAGLFGLHLLILTLGAGWLAVGIGVPAALAAGFTPFLIGGAVKSLLVVLAARALTAMPGLRRG